MPAMTVILVETNLFFSTALLGSLKRLGYSASVEKNWEGIRSKIESAAKAGEAQKAGGMFYAVIVNLAAPGLDAASIIKNLKSEPATAAIPVVGFAGHADRARLEAAASAGCDKVVTNGAISSSLEAILNNLKA